MIATLKAVGVTVILLSTLMQSASGLSVVKRLMKQYNIEHAIPKPTDDMNYTLLEEVARNGLDHTDHPKHVIIVGAGIAGLTAGYELKRAGHNVTILEANNRTGGRIETYRDPKGRFYAELGAMRIPDSHTLVNIYLQNFNLSLNRFIMSNPHTHYYMNGIRERSKVGEAHPALLGFDLATNETSMSVDELYEWAIKPVMDLVSKSGWEAAVKKYDHYSVKAFLEQSGLSSEAIRAIGVISNIQSLFQTAFLESIRDQTVINDDTIFNEIVGGSELLPNAMVDLLKDDIIKDAKVVKIKRSMVAGREAVVSYQTATGTASVSGDNVIVTATAPATSFIEFEPPLPSRKREALRATHYDASTKVYLHFREAFWLTEGIWGGKSVSDLNTRYTYYPSHNVTEGGVVLASYTWGEDAQKWTGLSNAECIDYALDMLSDIHGHDLRPLYSDGVVKKWLSDPYSLGAFVLFNPTQESEYYEDLMSPCGNVFFAGEHTTLNHAWIEGSISSALRAAVWISAEIFDVLVVGGGPMGLSSAYYAAQKGAKVAVLEKYSFFNDRGSSVHETRQFRIPYAQEYLATFATQSLDLWKDLENQSKTKLLNQTGHMFFGTEATGETNEGDLKQIKATCEKLKLGCEYLSASDIQKRFAFKNLPSDWVGILHNASGAIDVRETLNTLYRESKKLGVTLRDNSPVQVIDTTSTAKTSLVKVETNKNIYYAKRVILAPGPYANDVFKLLNFTIEMDIIELPTFFYKVKEPSPSLPVWFSFAGDPENLFYGFPEQSVEKQGYVRVATDIENRKFRDPSKRTNKVDPSDIEKADAFIQRYLPGLSKQDRIISNTTCLATSVIDDGFVLDFAPITESEHVIVYAAGWGFKFVPLFGKILASLALNGTVHTAYDITPFSIHRDGILKAKPKPTPPPEKQDIPIIIAGVMGGLVVLVLIGYVVRCVVLRVRVARQGYEELEGNA